MNLKNYKENNKYIGTISITLHIFFSVMMPAMEVQRTVNAGAITNEDLEIARDFTGETGRRTFILTKFSL